MRPGRPLRWIWRRFRPLTRGNQAVRLTCPECGFSASLTGWSGEERMMLQALDRLPGALSGLVVPYIALFRPAKQALAMSRASRLTLELHEMVASGQVSHGHGAPRACPPEIWAVALREILDNPAKVRRPLKSHGYLTAIAYGLADQADAQAERQREERARHPAVSERSAAPGKSAASGSAPKGRGRSGPWRPRWAAAAGCGMRMAISNRRGRHEHDRTHQKPTRPPAYRGQGVGHRRGGTPGHHAGRIWG